MEMTQSASKMAQVAGHVPCGFMFLGFLHYLSCSFHVSSILLSFSFRVFSFSFLLGDMSFHFQQISCQFLLTSLSLSANFLSVSVHFPFIFSTFHPRFWSFPGYVWFSSGSGGFLLFCPQGLRHLYPRFFCFMFLGFLNFLSLSSHFPFCWVIRPFIFSKFPFCFCSLPCHSQPISFQFLFTSLSFSAHFIPDSGNFPVMFGFQVVVVVSSSCPQGLRHLFPRFFVSIPWFPEFPFVVFSFSFLLGDTSFHFQHIFLSVSAHFAVIFNKFPFSFCALPCHFQPISFQFLFTSLSFSAHFIPDSGNFPVMFGFQVVVVVSSSFVPRGCAIYSCDCWFHVP